MAVLFVLMLVPVAILAEDAVPHELRLVYAAPDSQILTDENGAETTADTLICLYSDGLYRQFVILDGQTEPYSEGAYEIRAAEAREILAIHVRKYRQPDGTMADVDLSYEVNMEDVGVYRLHPKDVREDLKLSAVFMHGEKQKLVFADGTETYLPTVWLYFENGSFLQYVLGDAEQGILFSSGDYSISGDFETTGSVLTIHRTQKYRDGVGLADYDSTHDYEIGSLGFFRIWPEE